MANPEVGGAGGPDPPEKLQAIIQWLAIIGTPVKRHFNGVLLADRWWPNFSGISILSPSHQLKKVVSVGPPLTKLSGSTHDVQ